MNKITSDEFQKKFSRYQAEAHRGAVIITDHGEDDLALISANEYKRLRKLDQKALYAHELSEEVVNELGTVPIPQETRRFDDEY